MTKLVLTSLERQPHRGQNQGKAGPTRLMLWMEGYDRGEDP